VHFYCKIPWYPKLLFQKENALASFRVDETFFKFDRRHFCSHTHYRQDAKSNGNVNSVGWWCVTFLFHSFIQEREFRENQETRRSLNITELVSVKDHEKQLQFDIDQLRDQLKHEQERCSHYMDQVRIKTGILEFTIHDVAHSAVEEWKIVASEFLFENFLFYSVLYNKVPPQINNFIRLLFHNFSLPNKNKLLHPPNSLHRPPGVDWPRLNACTRARRVRIHNWDEIKCCWSIMSQIYRSRSVVLFMLPDQKMSGLLWHGLCIGVRKHLVSVNYRTNAMVDASNFSVAHWRWLEEGFFQWSAPPLIQDGCYSRHLGFGFHRLEDKHLGRLIRFFCGLLGVTSGRFLSMISYAAHPRWPPF
jgi:hypothetical protein